jgi:hypothetical protein
MDTYLDIETLPCQQDGIRDEIRDTISPPANYKKPEAIEKWWNEHGEEKVEEAYRKTALDGGYGEIVVIGYAVEDHEVSIISWPDEDEKMVLTEFWDAIDTWMNTSAGQYRLPHFIGHNIAWDLKFLWQRSIINNIKPPIRIPWRDAVWSGKYTDTMTLWAGPRDTISLTNLCKVLGIEMEDEIDGSHVWDMWQKKEYDKISHHCKLDVEKVREIHKRLT